jgi:hypothetical protein
MSGNANITLGREIEFEQAPCNPFGVISADNQQESKEGTCRCPGHECCVDAIGILVPHILKNPEKIKAR